MDPKLIEVGGRYRIEAEVEVVTDASAGDGEIQVLGLRPYDVKSWIDPKHFVSRVEEPIRVGDRVRVNHDTDHDPGEVLAVDKGHAWVLFCEERETWPVSQLERIP